MPFGFPFFYNDLGLKPETAYKIIRGIVFRPISNEDWRANEKAFDIRKPLAGIVRSGLTRAPLFAILSLLFLKAFFFISRKVFLFCSY